ncbi:DegT/DnrJ/EryC1/StrS aminotransferase family protein [Candidatus Pelagibacter sp.]|jgi:CDP-4-dehydro-6-deoxyglucose reductase, E1|nr:DegT/DnrJ/EryC1/StrS aminotransferase family protein [Candidatus Pelagibacter sp.]
MKKKMKSKIKFPLMQNNILKQDINSIIKFLKTSSILTQNKEVLKFEKIWSKWLGVKYSVFVNSGSSANLLSIQLLKIKYPKGGEVIVPPLTWSSDISSLIHCGFKPVFADIDLNTLGMNTDAIISKVNKNTKAVFLSYIQGFNCLTKKLYDYLKKKKILLIEDVCESHGAKFKNKKLGSFGWTSNFSFYYAHHMSTIEGGMICTNDKKAYYDLLMLRSHGMIREVKDEVFQNQMKKKYKDLNTKFIFYHPAYNVRNTEIGAIMGQSQIKRLDQNIKKRNLNLNYFLKNLDKEIYFVDFDTNGQSNYAFNVILKDKNKKLMNELQNKLEINGVEFRMGSAGGGNQLRQPYIKKMFSKNEMIKYKNTEHIHFYGMYIGNYPELNKKKIDNILNILNSVKK